MSTVTSTTSTSSSTAAALSQLVSTSGSSSGLNDNTIISELVSIESQPYVALQTQTTALQSQISTLGQISSALSTFSAAAESLQTNGVVGLTAGSNTAFTASADVGAQPGSYQVDVETLAVGAKARSQGFASTDTVQGGTLNFTVQGQAYSFDVADGSSLSQVASNLSSAGIPITASVISDGTDSYLSITDNTTGYPIGGSPSDALAITFTPSTGATGTTALAFSSVATAANATLTVDNLPITSQSNIVSTVIPGITLNLTGTDTAAETLNIEADTTATANNLQAFVTAYNGVMTLLQAQLNVSAGADSTTSLAGDSTLTNLQQRMQALFTSTVSEASGINSLPAMGLTTSDTDGSLSLDTTVLSSALASNPASLNAIFGLSADSIGQLAQQIATDYTDPATGALAVETDGLNDQITENNSEEDDLQAQIATYQANLVQEFSTMESLVSSLKSGSSYLTAQSNAASSSSS